MFLSWGHLFIYFLVNLVSEFDINRGNKSLPSDLASGARNKTNILANFRNH